VRLPTQQDRVSPIVESRLPAGGGSGRDARMGRNFAGAILPKVFSHVVSHPLLRLVSRLALHHLVPAGRRVIVGRYAHSVKTKPTAGGSNFSQWHPSALRDAARRHAFIEKTSYRLLLVFCPSMVDPASHHTISISRASGAGRERVAAETWEAVSAAGRRSTREGKGASGTREGWRLARLRRGMKTGVGTPADPAPRLTPGDGNASAGRSRALMPSVSPCVDGELPGPSDPRTRTDAAGKLVFGERVRLMPPPRSTERNRWPLPGPRLRA